MADEVVALQRKKFLILSREEVAKLIQVCQQRNASLQLVNSEDLMVTDLLASLGVVAAMEVDGIEFREAIVSLLPEHLQGAGRCLIVYNENEHVAAAGWSEQDVFSQAEDDGIEIDKAGAQWVLEMVNDKQDANLGISWGTITYWLGKAVEQGKAKKKEETDED